MKESVPQTHIQSGFPVLGVLGLLLVTLKATGYIDWAWWLVLAPFWLPLLVAVACLVPILVLTLLIKRETKKIAELTKD